MTYRMCIPMQSLGNRCKKGNGYNQIKKRVTTRLFNLTNRLISAPGGKPNPEYHNIQQMTHSGKTRLYVLSSASTTAFLSWNASVFEESSLLLFS
jgi:hypothetical protein